MEDDSFQYDQGQHSYNSDDQELQQALILSEQMFDQLPKKMQEGKIEAKQEVKKELLQVLTPIQFNEENAVCKICYKFAINAVLCKNQKCSILFCQTCATESSKKKAQSKCPFCRIHPFELVDSPYKKIINRMELVCKLCHQKYLLEEEQNHYKKACTYFTKIKCQFCQQMLQKQMIIKHTRLNHQNKIDQIIQQMYSNPRPVCEPKKVINNQQFYLNKIHKLPKLGTTGKFYCGAKLGPPKCYCCNGYCGPSNGQNCVQCMKLDIIRLGLSKGYLVNSTGNICWKKGEQFICNVMINYDNTNCQEGGPCGPCRSMKKTISRYQDLL